MGAVQIGCVLMASGFGRRFGGNKLLAPVDGAPLIARMLAALPAALFAKAVAVSQYDGILAAARVAGYVPLYNAAAEEGISASIRLGLSALPAVDGVLFSVCDQPWLTRASVTRLCAAFAAQPDRIVALARGGVRGNPVIFPAALFPALAALTGETGGGAVLRAHAALLLPVEADSARELDDVDTPADLPGAPAPDRGMG